MAKRQRQSRPEPGVEKAFGNVMRAARERLGMSQMDLQMRTGLDRTFISDLERGVQGPSLRTIFRVAKGLNMAPNDLVRRTAKSPYFAFPSGKEEM